MERALDAEPENAAAWDTAARLWEARGEARSAAEALEKAADCLSGGESATRRYHAAALIEASDAHDLAGRLATA